MPQEYGLQRKKNNDKSKKSMCVGMSQLNTLLHRAAARGRTVSPPVKLMVRIGERGTAGEDGSG